MIILCIPFILIPIALIHDHEWKQETLLLLLSAPWISRNPPPKNKPKIDKNPIPQYLISYSATQLPRQPHAVCLALSPNKPRTHPPEEMCVCVCVRETPPFHHASYYYSFSPLPSTPLLDPPPSPSLPPSFMITTGALSELPTKVYHAPYTPWLFIRPHPGQMV